MDCRKGPNDPSHFEQSLVPTLPSLLLGVSRRFGAAACVQSITSPNEGFNLCELIVSGTVENVNKHF